jgi:OPA family glycerol-3-phosphate transporter-like MFS transporter
MKTTIETTRVPSSLIRWQRATVILMVAGYAGYYLCRSNLSVCIPLIRDDLVRQGFDPDTAKKRLGLIVSFGVLAYAIGKFFAGGLADFQGGKRNFLGGMIGSIGFTILFALGGSIPLFTLASVGNRFVQSFGWGGMIKVTSRWFPHGSYGRVMAFISLSFLFGDALARKFMGYLLAAGCTWQQVYFVCAGTLFVLLVINLAFLKESPREIGEPEPASHSDSLFGEQGNDPVPPGLWALLKPLFRRRVFWYVCMLSLGLTLLRETFNTWIPTYFNEFLRMSHAEAASKSAWFPLVGGISVLLAGFASDGLGRASRALIIVVSLLLTTLGLVFLGLGDFGGSALAPVILVTLIGFLLIGPYSYLAGAISLDFGGKQGSSTASGFIDGIGYLGGMMAGDSMARLVVQAGWNGAFLVLSVVALLSTAAAVLLLLEQLRQSRLTGPITDVV